MVQGCKKATAVRRPAVDVDRALPAKKLNRSLTIFGRLRPSKFRVKHPDIAPSHCVLYWDGSIVWVVDLFSESGLRWQEDGVEVGLDLGAIQQGAVPPQILYAISAGEPLDHCVLPADPGIAVENLASHVVAANFAVLPGDRKLASIVAAAGYKQIGHRFVSAGWIDRRLGLRPLTWVEFIVELALDKGQIGEG